MRYDRPLLGLLIAVSVGVACAVGPGPAAAATDEQLLAQVRAAWQAREEATHKVRMAWTFKMLTPKGGRNSSTPQAKDGQPRPAADTTFDGTASLLLDGLKCKYALSTQIWSEPERAFVRYRGESVFMDGVNKKVCSFGGQDWPNASIKKTKWNDECGESSNWPPVAAARGRHPEASRCGRLEDFTSVRKVEIGGKSLLELTRPRTEIWGEIKIWVSPEQDYVPVRHESYHPNGELVLRTVVTPRRYAPGVWLPATWTTSSFWRKRLEYEVTAAMSAVEIDRPVGPADFDVTFPPGATVIDDTGEDTVIYVIKENNQKRVVLNSELLATHEEWMRTETGDLVPGPKRPRWLARNWWALAVGAVVLACTVVLVTRAVRRRARGADHSNGGTT